MQSSSDAGGITNDFNSWWIIDGEPAYGLIFGAYMACGALGGLVEPIARDWVSRMVTVPTPLPEDLTVVVTCSDDRSAMSSEKEEASAATENTTKPDLLCQQGIERHPSCTPTELSGSEADKSEWSDSDISEAIFDHHLDEDSITNSLDSSISSSVDMPTLLSENTSADIFPSSNTAEHTDDERGKRPAGVELLTAASYAICAGLLAVPMIVSNKPYAFSVSLCSFLIYEVIVGIYLPCDGVLRTIYMPNESICSVHTMLRVIVNVAVAAGVISTNFIS